MYPLFKTAGRPLAEPSGKTVVIAVDGPAASGKGTLARKLADRFGYAYLDTGALYRAVAYAVLEIGGDPSDINSVRLVLDTLVRSITPELLANPALREHHVSEAASKVAALTEVRIALIDFQREFAKNPPGGAGGAVLDGRDIGTIICPEADMKFFVTASAEERAKRRFKELWPTRSDLTLEKVLEDIRARDERDSTRKSAPTAAAVDAYTIDTTALTPDAVVDEAVHVMISRMLAETGKYL
jgi:CMP/dCMP kinase